MTREKRRNSPWCRYHPGLRRQAGRLAWRFSRRDGATGLPWTSSQREESLMDSGEVFDRLISSLGRTWSRRGVVQVAVATWGLGGLSAPAAAKRKKKRCKGGKRKCSGRCLDPLTDFDNCGTCGNVCGQGQTCMDGTCTGGAPQDCTGQPDLTNCGGGQQCSGGCVRHRPPAASSPINAPRPSIAAAMCVTRTSTAPCPPQAIPAAPRRIAAMVPPVSASSASRHVDESERRPDQTPATAIDTLL